MPRIPLSPCLTNQYQDGHNDWPHLIRGFYDSKIETPRFDAKSSLAGHVDLKRLLQGKSGGVFLSAYIDW